jgi:hypothetical protein
MLPDHSASITCVNCTVVGHLTNVSVFNGRWRCPSCRALHEVAIQMGKLISIELIDRLPMPPIRCSPGVLRDAREAFAAFNASAPRAAVVMIRRALERSCNEAGAQGGSLYEKLADAHDRLKVIDKAQSQLASGMRLFGNYGAHPNDDLLDDVTADEAEVVLKIGVQVLSAMTARLVANAAAAVGKFWK